MNYSHKIIFILIILLIFIYNFTPHIDQIKINLLNQLVVLRGILAPNCPWYTISDLILDDGAGIHLYNKYKQKYGDFALTQMFGEKIYIVTNNRYIKDILDHSPNTFSVGNLKKKFFKAFMSKNVGVSTGCPWKKRRYINEMALVTDRLHTYAEKYNQDMIKQLQQWESKTKLKFTNFFKLGKKMVSKIVFNADTIDDDVFNIFAEANSTQAFFNPNFKIDPKIYKNYIKVLTHYINNPNKNSLVELCLQATSNKEEVLHQIPHFIFPIVGLFVTTIPRLLLLLCNHPDDFKKVLQEVASLHNTDNASEIYGLQYLRKCILETLRLNNTVITTFRTLTRNYNFDNKYFFKKGTQFVILNNPVLREKEFFSEPNRFIPSRWTPTMEKSYYAISFNQGPQRCPGKELAIYLAQNFIFNLIKIKKIGTQNNIITDTIPTQSIAQILNPCKIRFYFHKTQYPNSA